MKETGTFLQRAALASLVAIPIAASSAVILSNDDRQPCDGCGLPYAPEDLLDGEDNTHWCSGCVDAAADILGIDPIVIEEDGEL